MRRLRWSVAAFAAALLAANAWHIARQAAPPTWDDAFYLETSFRLATALKHGLLSFLLAYEDALRIKAPLLTLVPLPLYALFGMGERVAVWVNEPLLALTLWFVFLIGRRLYGERAALCAVVACGLLPLVYGLSRLFFVECLLGTLVVAAHWLILETRADDPRAGWRLGAVLGLGLLAKVLFPLYMAAAVWRRRKILLPHARKALGLGGAIAASWYAVNFPYIAGFAVSAGFGKIGHDYRASITHFVDLLGRHAFSWKWLACAAIAYVALPRSARKAWRWSEAETFCAGWLLLPLGVMLAGSNKEIRFIAPALPAAALLAGAAAARLIEARRGALAALLILPPLMVFASQTFGVPSAGPLWYNGPPTANSGWDRAALIDAVAAAVPPDGVVAVALEHRKLNANNLASLAASRGMTQSFVNLGYAQSSVENALIRLKDKGARWVILVDGVPSENLPEFLNRANAGLAERVRGGKLAAARVARLEVAPGISAELWRLGAS